MTKDDIAAVKVMAESYKALALDAWGIIYELQNRNDDVTFYRNRLFKILMQTNQIDIGIDPKSVVQSIRRESIKGLKGPYLQNPTI